MGHHLPDSYNKHDRWVAKFACKDLSRNRLIDGAVEYNGGGVPNYKEAIEAALKEIGDIPTPPLTPAEVLVASAEAPALAAPDYVGDAGRLVAGLVAAAGARGAVAPVRRVDLRFGSGGEFEAVSVEFGPG